MPDEQMSNLAWYFEAGEREREKARVEATINDLFHKCWGEALASPDYDKSNWVLLQRELQGLKLNV